MLNVSNHTLMTDSPICPYCNYSHKDFWEVPADEGNFECESCGKEFFYSRNIYIDYPTYKLKDGKVVND